MENTVQMQPVYIGPSRVAELYGISLSKVYDAIRDGRLPARRFGPKRWLIRPEDATRWIEENSISNQMADA